MYEVCACCHFAPDACICNLSLVHFHSTGDRRAACKRKLRSAVPPDAVADDGRRVRGRKIGVVRAVRYMMVHSFLAPGRGLATGLHCQSILKASGSSLARRKDATGSGFQPHRSHTSTDNHVVCGTLATRSCVETEASELAWESEKERRVKRSRPARAFMRQGRILIRRGMRRLKREHCRGIAYGGFGDSSSRPQREESDRLSENPMWHR
ncbi:hypothetical protein BZA05DRAFT_270041 [Tricharina praecox]|uniref:uncharacterized protein n=1 Tax=Tricharina praecox TaxID=43433 RepID=UPI00221F4E6D|nr:uncharacterized protein BZA05DRAFT_270041 [Tricharina praecox]KAI5853780.1 hypothetical protein BZA05DRAFT_270041 [Tricharina praecox]